MTNDVSTEMEYDTENWSTSDLGIIIMMIAVIVVIQYNFFFNISWIQFIERNIIIAPAIIGLMLQFNFYFKRVAMKIGVATNSIIKRTTLNNVKTNVVVKTFIATLTMIINLTVKRIYSITVTVINFVAKKPLITLSVNWLLFSMDWILYFSTSYYSRTVEASYLSLIILIASFSHIKFVRISTCLAILLSGIYSNLFFGLLFVIFPFYQDPVDLMIMNTSFILIFCFSLLHDLHSHEIVYIAVTVSVVIFAHDLALSFVEIPHFVNAQLLHFFGLSSLYICMFNM